MAKKRSLTTNSDNGAVDKSPANAVVVLESSRQILAAIDEKEAKLGSFIEACNVDLHKIRNEISTAKNEYRKKIYDALQDTYRVYQKIVKSEHAADYFKELKGYFRMAGIKTQANTTDEALVIRYVWGASTKPKQVYDYGTVLAAANSQAIEVDKMAEWVKGQTITKVIEDHKALTHDTETLRERMNRARIVVMRLIEVRESKPLTTFELSSSWSAEQNLSQNTDMCVMLGTATRKMDGQSWKADINVTMFLPPNIDYDIFVINNLAKHLAGDVERWEQSITALEEKVWGDELYEFLWEREAEVAEATRQKWADKMQAGRSSKVKP